MPNRWPQCTRIGVCTCHCQVSVFEYTAMSAASCVVERSINRINVMKKRMICIYGLYTLPSFDAVQVHTPSPCIYYSAYCTAGLLRHETLCPRRRAKDSCIIYRAVQCSALFIVPFSTACNLCELFLYLDCTNYDRGRRPSSVRQPICRQWGRR